MHHVNALFPSSRTLNPTVTWRHFLILCNYCVTMEASSSDEEQIYQITGETIVKIRVSRLKPCICRQWLGMHSEPHSTRITWLGNSYQPNNSYQQNKTLWLDPVIPCSFFFPKKRDMESRVIPINKTEQDPVNPCPFFWILRCHNGKEMTNSYASSILVSCQMASRIIVYSFFTYLNT